MPKRIDLAIVPRDRLAAARLPAMAGGFPLDAVFEFALARNHGQLGSGSPRALLSKVDADVAKMGHTTAAMTLECLRAGRRSGRVARLRALVEGADWTSIGAPAGTSTVQIAPNLPESVTG